MRRALAPLALLVPLLLPAAASAGPVRERVPLRAKLVACTTGPERAMREATFIASMPDRPGASVLELRFSLQRLVGGRWSRLDVPEVEAPERSRPGAAGLLHEKSIDGLAGPGRYRASVRFIWRDADGDVIARGLRRTRACRQLDFRPDLAVEGIAYADGAYRVAVVNEGRGAAEDGTELVLGVAGANQPAVAVPALAPGGRTQVVATGPPCRPGEAVRVTVDAGSGLAERHEHDNTVDLPCPAP